MVLQSGNLQLTRAESRVTLNKDIFLLQFDVQDIEQLVELGKDLETCPYYGSRLAVPQAQVFSTI